MTKPETLGSAAFRQRYGVRLNYMAGAMAFGIASEGFVEAMSGAGLLASFGAAGLDLPRIAAAVARLRRSVPALRLCVNLIHSPDDDALEHQTVTLLIEAGVSVIEASAFMRPTAALVRFRAAGGRVLAKCSRRDVAVHFLQPPPADLLAQLAGEGAITEPQAAAAARRPLADDITIEADSGGHTDNQALLCAFPAVRALQREIAAGFPPAGQVGLGAAGGLGTPDAIAAAFALGAEYVVTGSINQACTEAATSAGVKRRLAELDPADVAMAPAGDMFELGARVQVVRRGSLFAVRAQRLHELYRRLPGIEALGEDERDWLQTQLFHTSIEDIWEITKAYWAARDPAVIRRAEADPKVRMALLFRWYLGMSCRWAIAGAGGRETDFQIWCGPAMGAFNGWARGTPFAAAEQRSAPAIASALMGDAARHLDTLFAPPAEVAPSLRDWLIAQIARQMDLPEEEIDPRVPFESYAMDSVAALMILGRLERHLGEKLSPTLMWNYPTIDALSAWLDKAAVTSRTTAARRP